MEAFFVCKEIIENAHQNEENSGLIARKVSFFPGHQGLSCSVSCCPRQGALGSQGTVSGLPCPVLIGRHGLLSTRVQRG